MKVLLKYRVLIIVALVSIALVFIIYFQGKKAGENKIEAEIKAPVIPQELPNAGSDIPQGWTPTNSVRQIFTAIDGLLTDEEAIFYALNDKTDGQLVAIYNEYGATYNETLFEALQGDLSGDELARALNYFNGLITLPNQ